MESSWKAFLGNVSGSVLFCLDPDLSKEASAKDENLCCVGSSQLLVEWIFAWKQHGQWAFGFGHGQVGIR